MSFYQIDKNLLQLEYILLKQEAQEETVKEIERDEPIEGPEAETFQQDKPKKEKAKELPKTKVRTKIYELVHRGGRTFERARTAWVNPDVAKRLEQRRKTTDWIRMLGNYIPLFFVGGYVRDKFFKKVSKDIDVIALMDLEEVKKILDSINISYKEKNHEHARLTFQVGGMKVDLVPSTPNDLLSNLKRRDFTINAIAQSVTGQFYDPTRGLDDVKVKILRSPNNDSITRFKKSPITILRAARFLSDFNIKPHSTLLEALETSGEELKRAKTPRVGFELSKILQTEKPWIGLKLLADNNLLKYISHDLAKTVGFKQVGGHYKDNVWNHTLAALKNAKSNDLVLNLALLFHDVGKPAVANDAKTEFPDHDKRGAIIAEEALLKLGYPKPTIKRVVNLIEHHLFVGKITKKEKLNDYRELTLALGGDINRFFQLVRADWSSHKNYKSDLVDYVEEQVKKISKQKPKESGEEELSKAQHYLDESLGILFNTNYGVGYIDDMMHRIADNG